MPWANIAFEHPAAQDDDYALRVGTEGMWHLHDFEISGAIFQVLAREIEDCVAANNFGLLVGDFKVVFEKVPFETGA